MRAVKVLLLAAFVCAVANAADDKKFVPVQPSHADTHKKLADHMSRIHAKINVAGAQKTVSNAFDEVKALSEIVTMKKSFQAEQFSAEVAACLADLNFIQAATPIQPICLADPAAVRASSGTFTQVSQVAGVCSGACVTALVGTLGNYKTCLRAFGFASLVDLMTSCQRTPECWTESVLTTRLSIDQTCMVPFSAAVGLYNYSTAAVTDAKAFCTGGCSSKMSTFIKTYPQCIVNTTLDESVQQASAIAALAESLCSQKGNETDVCGVQLKALGRFSECGGYYCSATSWCNNNCMPDYTVTRMDAMCGRCMTELGAAFKAFGVGSANTAIESLCLKTGPSASSSYCAVEFGSSLYYSSQSQSAFNTLCGGKRGSCVSRALTLQARATEESAIEEFAQCAVNYRRRGVSVSSSSSFCSSNLAYELRSAYEGTRYAKAVCAKSASVYCWPTVYDMYWSDGCVRSSSCSASCKTSWSAQVTAAGCCTGYMDDYRSYSTSSRRLPTRTVTVTRGVYNITLDRIVAVQFSATVGEEQARSSRYTNGYTPCYTGDAAFWTTWESTCQVGNLTTPVKGELKLNLAYETLNADPLAKARAEAALTDDVAAAAAVASNQVSGSIVSASATRRQTTTTKAKFQYSINAGSQAEADAAVAAVNAQVSAGTLKLPAAQSTVATCTTCGASSSSSTVAEGQAAPATVRPVIGAPGSSASPAAAAHAAVAVVFAVAMAMLL